MTPDVIERPAGLVALSYANGGARFAPPASAAWWRVKRFGKTGRGSGDLVYGPDGMPLFIPIDADHASLRAAVGDKPGKYKLDPVDENHVEVESPSAYALLGGEDVGTIDMRDEMIYRLVRTNKEITETVVEKFSMVMDAAAKVLHAADGAGIPQRQPVRPVVQVMDSPRAPEPQLRDDKSSGMGRLAALAEQFSPLLGHLMCTKLIGLSDEETAALMSNSASPPVASTVQRIEGDERPTLEASDAQAPQAPVTPAEQLARVMAQLTPEERQAAMSLARGLPPEDRQRWIATLMGLSLADAVAEVRNILRRAQLDAQGAAASPPAARAASPVPASATPAPAPPPAPPPLSSAAPQQASGVDAPAVPTAASPKAAKRRSKKRKRGRKHRR